MRDTPHQLPPERTTQILWEAAVVCKAIKRYQRTATYRGEAEEANEMGALGSGVSEMVLALTRQHQQSTAA